MKDNKDNEWICENIKILVWSHKHKEHQRQVNICIPLKQKIRLPILLNTAIHAEETKSNYVMILYRGAIFIALQCYWAKMIWSNTELLKLQTKKLMGWILFWPLLAMCMTLEVFFLIREVKSYLIFQTNEWLNNV